MTEERKIELNVKPKNILKILFLVLVLISCKTSDNSIQNVENWDEFYVKFHQDSLFQISRIHDSIEAVQIDGGATKYLTKENWVMMKGTIYEVDTTIYKVEIEMDSASVHHRVYIENSGFDVQIYFNLIDNKWYLTKFIDQNL